MILVYTRVSTGNRNDYTTLYIIIYTFVTYGWGGWWGGCFNPPKRYLEGLGGITGNRNDYTTFIIFIDTFVTLISERVYMR